MRQQTSMMAMAVVLAATAGAGLVAADLQSDSERFTLSAVVVDKAGSPVRNLTANDFKIIENGKTVPVTTFKATTIGDSATRGRAVTLVLGAGGTDPELTMRVQTVARGFLDAASANDQVSVVRYAYSAKDEVAGNREEMLSRIAEYRAPMGEPLSMRSPRDILDLVARLSNEMADIDTSRRAIVFIGSPYVFDIWEPVQREYQLEWPHWVKALNAAAKANVSVYVIDPVGLRGNVRINADGLIAQTGGTVFYNRNDLTKAIDLVWGETSSYYALEYAATPTKRDLQKISVTVSKPDVTVRARRSR